VTAARIKAGAKPEVPRLALSRSEAADALGVSVDLLEQHVLHDVRMVRRGHRCLIPGRAAALDREQRPPYPWRSLTIRARC
jgi:hypothetical protein